MTKMSTNGSTRWLNQFKVKWSMCPIYKSKMTLNTFPLRYSTFDYDNELMINDFIDYT